jgi:hypothetical protein
MGALTEAEIFDCLTDNFKRAANLCEQLARNPRRGPIYRELRTSLKLIEGACRQASAWREDTRWLKIGLLMADAHKRAGDWLRGVKMANGGRMKLAEGHLHPCFLGLADNLRAGARKAEEFRHAATGRAGMILPTVQHGPHRDTVPVGWRRPSGLIVPNNVSVQ